MSRPNIKKGSLWRKKRRKNGDKTLGEPFFCEVIGKAKDDKVKTVCSDGNTHSFIPFILQKYFELVD